MTKILFELHDITYFLLHLVNIAKGASDAADWAISRSLSALLQAEKKGGGSSRIDGSSLGSRSTKGDGSV